MRIPHFIPTAGLGGSLLDRYTSPAYKLQADDSAIHAYTDFVREYPIVVDEDRQIDDALTDMIRYGVRALLVTHEGTVTGLVTSYDIQGERPLQFLANSNYSQHDDIRVGDIFTPWHRLPAIDLAALNTMTTLELLLHLQDDGLTHLIVLESFKDPLPVVRGIVSRSQLERQLAGHFAIEGIRHAS
jgi:CBS domain-containing protein